MIGDDDLDADWNVQVQQNNDFALYRGIRYFFGGKYPPRTQLVHNRHATYTFQSISNLIHQEGECLLVYSPFSSWLVIHILPRGTHQHTCLVRRIKQILHCYTQRLDAGV
jgi:hypothetical protein